MKDKDYIKNLINAAKHVIEVDDKLTKLGVDEVELREARLELKLAVKDAERWLT